MIGRRTLRLCRATEGRGPAFWMLAVCLLTAVVVAGTGCSVGRSAAVSPPRSTASPSATLRNSTPEPRPTAEPTPTMVDPSMPMTLTVWLPPDMALSAQSNGQALQVINEGFRATNPNTFVEIVPKAAYGTGGIVSAILATQPVVPSRLPDIIAIDTAEVDLLVAQGILAPLDDLLPEAIWQDIYPSVVGGSNVHGIRFAVPFQVDIDFVAYNTGNIELAPRTWAEMEGSEARYVFPASQGDGSAADAFLLQYLALGGQLLNEGGRPYLDPAIMASVLAVYRQAVDAGVVPIAIRNLQTLDDCWDAYMQDKATMTNVPSWLYQREKGALRRTQYAAVPTANGAPSTLARSWSWAIVASDPVRQDIAARYMLAALDPTSLSRWSVESGHLPAHRKALSLAVDDESYRTFLEEQLQHAYPYPDLSYYTRLQAIIVRAVEDVLDGVSTPERAAVTAAAMAARLR